MYSCARSTMLLHQRLDNRRDDFNCEPGCAAYMISKYLDWPTICVKVVESLVKSVIEVPDSRIFKPTNSNNATSDIGV
jgi:hypothetical protein